jgi:aminopeptidase N
VLDSILGKKTSGINMAGATLGEREEQRLGYSVAADLDPIGEKAYDYYSYNSYGGITYGKTASVLLTLESLIGEDIMAKAMRTYFMKYRFTHPTKADFLNTIQEVSGKDLKWYFDQAIYGSPVMDYKVLRLESYPVNWYEKKGSAFENEDKNTVYRSYVWLQRKEDFVMPVDVEIRFDNGEKVREHWDGVSRWTRFTYEKKAKVESAEIDPDHAIQIDRNDFNNSYREEANPKPARKLENYWMFLTQWVAQALTWWAV